MCLGVPGLVVEVDELTAMVDFWGVRRRVRLDLVDEPVAIGDYVLNHVGFAIRRIPPDDVQGTLALYEDLLKQASAADLMTADVRSEIQAGAAGEAEDERAEGQRAGGQRAGGEWPR
jgi:hydrogenase expression/formation protein HypC